MDRAAAGPGRQLAGRGQESVRVVRAEDGLIVPTYIIEEVSRHSVEADCLHQALQKHLDGESVGRAIRDALEMA
jgi:hypothetical protein